ncbi:hypothetical protein OBBRIDRAFT_782191 [Obba rivulosa]|uniref:F-box domain-containing protein n=1 Tax=Obba rivulosa TaxID=1052685 RepID=A0A8E2AM58_9APHY|nr:hypothetical protein OBBRIDRAFT_782191 [Obba rivulosa]
MNSTTTTAAAATTTATHLLHLPPELLIRILSYLDYVAIITCQQTCRLFRDLVATSSLLQYLIELGIAAYEDNPSSTVPLVDRLRLLKATQRAWNSLDFGPPRAIRVPFNPSSIYDLSAEVFLLGETQSTSQFPGTDAVRFIFLDQPGMTDTPPWRSVDLQQKIIDVGLAVHEHDLMALVTYNTLSVQAAAISIHLVQLSTGEYHPAAAQPCILVSEGSFIPGECVLSIEIVGDTLGILLNFPFLRAVPRSSSFHIFNWKTGSLRFLREAPHGTYDAFVFLAADTIVLPNLHLNTLEICPVAPLSDDTDRSPAPLWTLYHLELPPLSDTAIPFRIWCRAEPNPTGPPTQRTAADRAPFRPDPASAIVLFNVFTFDGRHRLHTFSLLTHRTTLLRPPPCTAPLEPGDPAPHEPGDAPHVPWPAWGPPACRLFKADTLVTRWITTTCGQRFIANHSRARPNPRRGPPLMYDFNVAPHRRRAACAAAHGQDAVLDDVRFVEGVTRTEMDVFREPVETALPYVELAATGMRSHESLLLDECGVIGLELDVVLGNIRHIIVHPIGEGLS